MMEPAQLPRSTTDGLNRPTDPAPRAFGNDLFVTTFDRRGTVVYQNAASVPASPDGQGGAPANGSQSGSHVDDNGNPPTGATSPRTDTAGGPTPPVPPAVAASAAHEPTTPHPGGEATTAPSPEAAEADHADRGSSPTPSPTGTSPEAAAPPPAQAGNDTARAGSGGKTAGIEGAAEPEADTDGDVVVGNPSRVAPDAASGDHEEQAAPLRTTADTSAELPSGPRRPDALEHGTAAPPALHHGEPTPPALEHGESPAASLEAGAPPPPALEHGEPTPPALEHGAPTPPSLEHGAATRPSLAAGAPPRPALEHGEPTPPALEHGESPAASLEAGARPAGAVGTGETTGDVSPPVEPSRPAWPPGEAANRPRPVAAGQVTPAAAAEGFGSGQLVTGTVVSVDANEVVVDLGDRLGVIGRRHLTSDGRLEPSEIVSVGDRIEAAVLVREDPRNRVVLSHTWAVKQRAWQAVDEAMAHNRPVSGTVTEAVKGGVVVDIGIRAFLPASQLDVVHIDDLASWVGRPIEAMVAEADRGTDKVVLSRRALLRQQDRQRANELLASLSPGQVRRGRVATVTDFGAFVDLGGVRGLLHLSELSWERVERTTDVVRVGQEIDVKVLSVKGGAKRISLSLRALTPDPLEQLGEGQTLQGVVTRLVDFGAFVRVLDRVEGLVHVSELAEYRVHLPEEVVTPGDEVWVKVLRIDRKRRRVDLSVNQAVQY